MMRDELIQLYDEIKELRNLLALREEEIKTLRSRIKNNDIGLDSYDDPSMNYSRFPDPTTEGGI